MGAEPAGEDAFAALVREIRAARLARGLSLADVAAASGLTRPAICRIETGRNANPTVGTLGRYARACGVELHLAAR